MLSAPKCTTIRIGLYFHMYDSMGEKTRHFPTDKQSPSICDFLSGDKFLVSAIHTAGQ